MASVRPQEAISLISRFPGIVDNITINLAADVTREYVGGVLIFLEYSQKNDDRAGTPSNASSEGTKNRRLAASPLSSSLVTFDDEVGDGAYQQILERQPLSSKAGSKAQIIPLGRAKNGGVYTVVSLGSPEKLDAFSALAVGRAIATLYAGQETTVLGIVFPEASPLSDAQLSKYIQLLFEAFLLNLQSDNRFKTESKRKESVCLNRLFVYGLPLQQEAVLEAFKHAKRAATGVRLCQELINTPANYCNPTYLGSVAERIAMECNFENRNFGPLQAEILGMGAYLAVSKGSSFPPVFIHLVYKPQGEIKKRIALIGKGITFDSGGYNIKAAGGLMELMKFDMAGTAAVLGCAANIGSLKPEGVEVHFISATAENMISGNAYRPGDVIVAAASKTIEVVNTDAEGRLTLVDAIHYAEKVAGCDVIVDIATLTGAAKVALGPKYAALYCNDKDLTARLLQCSEITGDPVWHMPLPEEYRDSLNSSIADISNLSNLTRWGGSVTAALFLQDFVNKASWAHIDATGPIWDDAAGKSTGFGVRMLTEFVMSLSTQVAPAV